MKKLIILGILVLIALSINAYCASATVPLNISSLQNSSATATIDGKMDAAYTGGYAIAYNHCDSTRSNMEAGTLYAFIDANGDLNLYYIQRTTLNDNTYGTNAVGWLSGHKFTDLTGSDKAQFKITAKNGSTVLDVDVDYLTSTNTVASGYACLGLGGDGGLNSGSSANLLGAKTSLDYNFNVLGCALTANSPQATSNYTQLNHTVCPGNWIYEDAYEVKISHNAVGSVGFGTVDVVSVHDSPPKLTSGNVIYPDPCGAAAICGNSIVETGEDCEPIQGACCDSSCKFKSASTACDSWSEYGCRWGTGYMSDVGVNSKTKYCTGSSANCTGTITDSWTVSQYCAICKYCNVVGSDPKQAGYAVCSNSATSQLCNEGYECAPSSGNNQYFSWNESTQHQYNTQGYCDGSGTCDYAYGTQCTGIEPNWCRPSIAGCNNYCNSTYPYDDDMDGLNNTCDADCCENCDNDGDGITDVCDTDDDCPNCTTHPDTSDCNDKNDATNVCGGVGTSTICSEDPASETSNGTCVTCSSECEVLSYGGYFYCDGTNWQTGTGEDHVCRPSEGVCDIADKCNGAGDCNDDAKSKEECRAVAGLCDIAESCDGAGNDCPDDSFLSSDTICNYDPETYCPGNGPDCPEGGYCGDGTINTELGEECDNGTSNGDPCTPPYNGSCSYCNSSCKIITLNGPYCGDGDCDPEEDDDTCPEDCAPDATLLIHDSAEGSYVTPNAAVTYFALYKNATSNTHIYGATCYAEDEDGTYLMIEIPGGYYYYIKYGGFMYTGTKNWNVTCAAAGFPALSENDDILVHAFYGVVPEFSDYAMILIIVTAICGFYFVKRKKE